MSRIEVVLPQLAQQVEHLRTISQNPGVREIPLVYMDEEGAGRTGTSLGEELGVIAFILDALVADLGGA